MVFNENSRVKIPCPPPLLLLEAGYTLYSLREQVRREDTNIFESIFLESLQKINPKAQLDELKRVLDEVSLELDYEDIGEKFYQRLTVTSGIKMRLILKNFNNNNFHVTTELIPCKNGDEEFRPDITFAHQRNATRICRGKETT